MVMNKRGIAGLEVVLMILSVFAFAFILSGNEVSAQTSMSDPSVCCERTTDGAWCVNAEESECDGGYVSAPTSCETTSYCRTGTCYESEEGICMENTPQRVCNDNGGTWDEREIEQVPQCQLGCCIIADQAAFVPLVRCKRLSTFFGVENDYRSDITNEVACIATAQAQDVGACVYESDFERVCEFTTRGECGAGERVDVVNGTNVSLSSQRTFYEDYLCSAEELNTACAKQTGTTCYQGDVFWTDSCGNRENVYSDDKVVSWNAGKVLDADGICDPNDGSDIDCGNCDYLLGTRCAEFDGFIGGPKDGDNYCRTNECVDREDDERINGESWCVYDDNVGEGGDLVGSRYFREVCIDGEVNVEPCADFRNEVCLEGNIESSAGDFETAACRVNRWQDCVAQEDEDDCTNIDRRDCIWLPAVTGMVIGGQQQGGDKFSNPSTSQAFSNPTATGGFTGNVVAPITGQNILGGGDDDEEAVEETETNRPGGICVPNFPPGLEFWEDNNAQQICGQANAKCVVVYERGLIGGEKCVEGCECEDESWALEANRVCAGLGDCGGYVNFQGEYTDDGYKWVDDGEEKEFAPNSVNIISGGFTGLVVGMITGRALTEVVIGAGDAGLGVTPGDIVGSGSSSGAGSGLVLPPVELPSTNAMLGLQPTPLATTPVGHSQVLAGKGVPNLVEGTNLGGSGGGVTAPATFAQGTASATGEVIAYTQGGALAPGSYTAGTIGGHTLQAGQTAHIVRTSSGGYSMTVTNAQGGQVLQQASTSSTPFTAGTGVTSAGTALPVAPTFTNQATFAKWLRLTPGSGASAIVSGVQWAAVAYLVGQMIGPMIGLSDQNTKALSTSLAAGFGTYKLISAYNFAAEGAVFGPSSIFAPGSALGNPAMVGLGVGAIVFVMMYKKESVKIVEFNCMPWQAPTGGDVCEECNDADLPCSEYRCRSLGQNCEIVNAGSEQEACVNVNPQDVNPPIIKPNYEELSSGHEYTNVKNSPPGPGFNVVNLNASDGCLKAFTPLEFGIEVDEPAQCKISFEHTTSFEDMVTYVGGSNLFKYNHSERFSLPSAAAIENSSLTIENGKDLTFFLRCQDKNGNENEAEYAVRFCVDPTPDTTAPRVDATSVISGGCVAEDQTEAEVRFYTNEPAECRWSPQDQDFENMQGTMGCNNELYQANAAQLFTCVAELTGVPRDETNFYVRCKDYAEDRNAMKQSYEFKLRGSTGLKMKNLRPNETIFGAVSPAPVELYVETLFGCNEGQAVCSYSTTGENGNYIQFFDTNTEDGIHTQRLDLTAGNQKYYVKCTDEGGNVVEDVAEFRLDIDENAPVIARIYEEDTLLKIVTVRDSECSYSFDNCDFTFAEGTEMPYANSTVHVTEWDEEKTYYIKCRDEFRNEDADCSVVVRPTRDLFG